MSKNLAAHNQNITVETRLTLTNIRGLHARASAKFVTCAENFSSTVKV